MLAPTSMYNSSKGGGGVLLAEYEKLPKELKDNLWQNKVKLVILVK